MTMKLMTDELRSNLPPLYSQDSLGKEQVAVVKYFTPWANWTWYATEFDGNDTFFGWVEGFDSEFGYFSLTELESVEGPFGLKIERDLYFTPKPISQIADK